MDIKSITDKISLPDNLNLIVNKIINSERITKEEGLVLYNSELGILGMLANYVREQKHGQNTFFNKNIHIEPTNICVYNCTFCSYSRKQNEKGAWEHSPEEIIEIVKKYINTDITEIHIVGGVHPHRDIYFYADIIKQIKQIMPNIHIKAFTAVELDFMIKKAGLNIPDGLQILKDSGLNSIPGGGAEIFNEDIRKQICHEKSSSDLWLNIHETAHKIGIPSNATMLYGHIETYNDRIEHLSRLRDLQDKTNGFNAFIPLKYKSMNNKLKHIGEVNYIEDLKTYAVSRIFLDNIPHIKSYWPMTGKDMAQLSLSFGVDDVDGTIDDTTKIYSMAGAKDQKPTMSSKEMIELIKNANRIPVERNSVYDII